MVFGEAVSTQNNETTGFLDKKLRGIMYLKSFFGPAQWIYSRYCTPCCLLSAVQLWISFVARSLAASSRGNAAEANWAPKSWPIANPWTTFCQKIWTSSSTGNQEASQLTRNRFDESSKKGFIHLILMTQVEFHQRVTPKIQDKVVYWPLFTWLNDVNISQHRSNAFDSCGRLFPTNKGVAERKGSMQVWDWDY